MRICVKYQTSYEITNHQKQQHINKLINPKILTTAQPIKPQKQKHKQKQQKSLSQKKKKQNKTKKNK